MKYRTPGRDLTVSAIGLGCMGMTHAFSAPSDPGEMTRLIHEAVDLGYTVFDTAECYTGTLPDGSTAYNEELEAVADTMAQLMREWEPVCYNCRLLPANQMELPSAIGAKYGKTAAQVVLRWNVQRGVVVIPKSVKRERMEQNMDIWDFQLTGEEMAAIAPLDIGHSEIVDHFDPNFVKALHGRFAK